MIGYAWEAALNNFKSEAQSIHTICGLCTEMVLKASVANRTLDNITAVVVAFPHFKQTLLDRLRSPGGGDMGVISKNTAMYRLDVLQEHLGLPNNDLGTEDVYKPEVLLTYEEIPANNQNTSSGAFNMNSEV